MNELLKFDGAGCSLTEMSESLRLVAYKPTLTDPWTCGYGHTGPDVQQGTACTPAQALAWLEQDVQMAEIAVKTLVTEPLNQNQFDALVDFTFNEGAGHLRYSTLLKLLNSGDFAGADAEFAKWNLAGGRVLPGLCTRRANEAALFSAAATT